MNPFLLRFKRQITPTLTELRRPCSPRVRQSVNLSRTTTSAHNFLLPVIAALQPAAVKAAAVSHRSISSSATTLRQLGEVIRRHVYRCHRHANKQLLSQLSFSVYAGQVVFRRGTTAELRQGSLATQSRFCDVTFFRQSHVVCHVFCFFLGAFL